ncbi:MAG: glycine cleavage T C-terminal barrel domain-containing protein, partial [bacterium]
EIPVVDEAFQGEAAKREQQTFPWPIFPHPKGKDFVDFDEDVQVSDLRHAVIEGYEGMELLKRFTTFGMGPSQGRHSAVAALLLHSQSTGVPIEEHTLTTSRPPIGGEKFALLAGRSFEPVLRTPMHHRHLEAGARMMPAGQWLRPAFYGPPESAEARIEEEALGVRNQVGLIDVSTLGGIEIRGPDAPEFINRMYNTGHLKQPVGRCRYVLMTDMEGTVSDDGVACRLAEEHYYVTTTTTGSAGVHQEMLFQNSQWRLRVDIAQVSHAYCAVNLAGPHSREVLQRVCDDVDLSAENLPYLGAVRGTVAGIAVLIMRVGFVGELGYEIHAPWSCGEALWDQLIAAGKPSGIQPFGVEAQRVLRLEKGHLIIGQDTDGLTTPEEADLGWAVNARKPYFIGKRSQAIRSAGGLSRRLVGFSIEDAKAPVPRECHLVLAGERITGRVTSCHRSATLGKVIGLAYVEPRQAALGSKFEIKVDNGHRVWAQVVELPFYDPEGLRQRQ